MNDTQGEDGGHNGAQHHHGHSHGAEIGPASARVRRVLAAIVIPIIVATLVAMAIMWPHASSERRRLSGPSPSRSLIAAKVTNVDRNRCTSDFQVDAGTSYCDHVSIRLAKGNLAEFDNPAASGFSISKGDGIYVDAFTVATANGSEKTVYSFYEFKRERPLLALLVVFIVVAVAVGRIKGLRALIALAVSLAVLGAFILPAIAEGQSPLLVALVGSSVVMFLALYFSHGINVRTTSAVIGTIASLAITGALATISVSAARFTGLAGEETSYLRATSAGIDLRGILLAGIIIGALGVLDDVTITQSSAVWELHQANPSLGFAGVYNAALRIGRDHIASAVNTLVLAYAGASLPLLLLFTQVGTPFGELFNGEPVATEVVRMLAGSIGLMASVPITTALTALVVRTDRRPGVPAPSPGAGRSPRRQRWTNVRSSRPKEFVRPLHERQFRDGFDD